MEYPFFDLRLFRRYLQWTAVSVFGSLDPNLMTEFLASRLNGAEGCDWMATRPALKKAIITNRFAVPDLVEVAAYIVGA